MAFQASTELWAASGSDPLSPWQHSAPLRRVFDSTVRGYVVELQPLLAGAPKPCLAVGLPCPVLVLQVFMPPAHALSLELGVTDAQGTRRRLLFSTAFSEGKSNPLHAQVPLRPCRGAWFNLALCVHELVAHFFGGAVLRTVDTLTLATAPRLRRIFAMRDVPHELDGASGVPHSLELPAGVGAGTQVVGASSTTALSSSPAGSPVGARRPGARSSSWTGAVAFGRRVSSGEAGTSPSPRASGPAPRPSAPNHLSQTTHAPRAGGGGSGGAARRGGSAPARSGEERGGVGRPDSPLGTTAPPRAPLSPSPLHPPEQPQRRPPPLSVPALAPPSPAKPAGAGAGAGSMSPLCSPLQLHRPPLSPTGRAKLRYATAEGAMVSSGSSGALGSLALLGADACSPDFLSLHALTASLRAAAPVALRPSLSLAQRSVESAVSSRSSNESSPTHSPSSPPPQSFGRTSTGGGRTGGSSGDSSKSTGGGKGAATAWVTHAVADKRSSPPPPPPPPAPAHAAQAAPSRYAGPASPPPTLPSPSPASSPGPQPSVVPTGWLPPSHLLAATAAATAALPSGSAARVAAVNAAAAAAAQQHPALCADNAAGIAAAAAAAVCAAPKAILRGSPFLRESSEGGPARGVGTWPGAMHHHPPQRPPQPQRASMRASFAQPQPQRFSSLPEDELVLGADEYECDTVRISTASDGWAEASGRKRAGRGSQEWAPRPHAPPSLAAGGGWSSGFDGDGPPQAAAGPGQVLSSSAERALVYDAHSGFFLNPRTGEWFEAVMEGDI